MNLLTVKTFSRRDDFTSITIEIDGVVTDEQIKLHTERVKRAHRSAIGMSVGRVEVIIEPKNDETEGIYA